MIIFPHKLKSAPKLTNITFIMSFKVLFFLSSTPLDSREWEGAVSWIIPWSSQNELKGLDSYSPPLLVLSLFIFLVDFLLQLCILWKHLLLHLCFSKDIPLYILSSHLWKLYKIVYPLYWLYFLGILSHYVLDLVILILFLPIYKISL